MTAPHPHRTAATLGIASAGLTLGHGAAYAIATPGAHAREQLLHATGHGYMAFATQVAVLAGTLGLAMLFLSQLHRRESRGSFAHDAMALAVAQSGAFVAVEIAERLFAGASLHDLAHGPLLAIGLGVQILVALGGAWLMRLTDRASEVAGGLPVAAAHPPAVFATAIAAPIAGPRPPTGRAASVRGPPPFP